MEGYNGWRLLEDIIIVEVADEREGEIRKGYMVDPSNKKMLQNAISWGTRHRRNDAGGLDKIEPEIHHIKNSDFIVRLDKSPRHSWQGGKLSFSMCLVEKDGKTFSIGVDTGMLMEALKQSEVKNGLFAEGMMMARAFGKLGIIHSGMVEYNQAKEDDAIRKKNNKKTSKHEIGQSYETLTQSNIYLGEYYLWLTGFSSQSRNSGHHGVELSDKPVIQHVFPSVHTDTEGNQFVSADYYSGAKSTDEIWERCAKKFSESFEIKWGDVLYVRASEVVDKSKKLPARKIGEFSITDSGNTKQLSSLIGTIRKSFEKKILEGAKAMERVGIETAIMYPFMTASKDTKPEPLTELEKIGLRYLVKLHTYWTPLGNELMELLGLTAREIRDLKGGYCTREIRYLNAIREDFEEDLRKWRDNHGRNEVPV